MKAGSSEANTRARAAEILEHLGAELAFVEPGQDTGLLPINSFVADLEDLATTDAPSVVAIGVAMARGWLDQILDGSGKFTPESIQVFTVWHAWMSSALAAWTHGTAMPETPPDWVRPAPDPDKPPALLNPTPGTAADEVEPAILLNLADDPELLREFHSESLELLQNIEQGVLVLEENPADADTINSIFRAFHTFKGGAGFLHLHALRDMAHDLESLLDAVRRTDLSITSEIIDLILAGGDALRQFTREIGTQLTGANAGLPIVVPTRHLGLRVRAALRCEPAPVARPVSKAPPSAIGPASKQVESVKAASVPDDVFPDLTPPPPPPPPRPTARSPAPAAARRVSSVISDGDTGFVKIDTRKLDALVDLVGELVIAQSMVIQNPEVQRLTCRQLERSLRQLGRITTELQRNAMSLRMVPIRRAFQKLTRLVRDLAGQQEKQVQLVLEGEETELDRNIVEELGDPLVHMIRNSIDHGIEAPAVRVARGKPALGRIRLTASHQRGGIVIRIQDDGHGLDRERLLAKARERGLIKSDAALTEAEIFALVFAPGFSTAEQVTDLSGRGVGMDVVRRNIEQLRGKVEIHSVAGQGATFTIVLPLTLAIIDGMLVGVGDDRYILPTLAVRESFRPRPGMVTTVHERGEVVSVRGRLTPLLRLGQHLGTRARAVEPSEGIIVVVESGEEARGLLVDELIGKQEVVIKSLGETFKRQSLLAGAAILGDGRVGLILDVDSLVKCRAANT